MTRHWSNTQLQNVDQQPRGQEHGGVAFFYYLINLTSWEQEIMVGPRCAEIFEIQSEQKLNMHIN